MARGFFNICKTDQHLIIQRLKELKIVPDFRFTGLLPAFLSWVQIYFIG